MKNCNETIGNRTRDLLACSAVLQPTALPGVKVGRCVGLTTLPASCDDFLKSGSLNHLEPSGPLQACNLYLYYIVSYFFDHKLQILFFTHVFTRFLADRLVTCNYFPPKSLHNSLRCCRYWGVLMHRAVTVSSLIKSHPSAS